jgi:hypothetical protein
MHGSSLRTRGPVVSAALIAAFISSSAGAQPERRSGTNEPIPTIEAKTSGLKKMDGFFPLYWDEAAGRLWMEIPRLNIEVLHSTGLGAGLGSNDIGLDRGALAGSRIVRFERVGPRVLMVQPNYEFRATSTNPAEVSAVRDAFARSILWGFAVAAASGDRVLVDFTEFMVRDTHDFASRLRPGTYRFEPSRSTVYLPATGAFPMNTEMEAELTFALQPGGPGGPGGGPGAPRRGEFFEGVGSVAASAEAATFRVHHSIVQLPDDKYKPRLFDPRAGFGAVTWQDYSTPLGKPMTERWVRRHRLEKKDPSAKISDPVEPIVYYLDPGTPEPIRSALRDGAQWWNQAFEAAGYRNAFRVEMLPAGISALDIRYNVINWVHRSTRGWSTGGSVVDPRTGEIIKGVVTLGSLRIRQDYLIAEGLLSPYKTGDETPPELAEWGLARIRQLAAHEVGHTLGIGHNYWDSEAGRISVMDYPHPLVTLRPDGTLDYSSVYDVGIGQWDKVAIAWGYQHFPDGADERKALDAILEDAWKRDLRYMTNQDLGAHPRVDQWANGVDAPAELQRMLQVRRVALNRFGEQAIKRGQPLAVLEEVLVPLYLHHRYQVDAAASVVGGANYTYAVRGDGRVPLQRASAAQQTAALDALLQTIAPKELALPRSLVDRLPPRPPGYPFHRELFPRYTGTTFDIVAPAVVAADLTVSRLLDGERAARLVEQHAIDPALPGLEQVIDRLFEASFGAAATSPYEAEIARGIQHGIVDRLVGLAATAAMPQVRALATLKLREKREELQKASGERAAVAHSHLMASEIERFLERPGEPARRMDPPDAPPGAPIGEPAMDWLRWWTEPECSGWIPRNPPLDSDG